MSLKHCTVKGLLYGLLLLHNYTDFIEVYADKVEENNLTEKELFVLKAIARGNKNKEIAFDMGIAERTVKAYLTNIYNKLGVNSRSEAVAVSIERKLIHFKILYMPNRTL